MPGDSPRWPWGRGAAGVRTEFGRFSTRLHPYLGDACKVSEDTTVRTVTPTPCSCATHVPPPSTPPASLPATPSCGSVAFSIPSHHCPQAGRDKARTCPGKDASSRYSHPWNQARHSRHSTHAGHCTWHSSNPGTCGEKGGAAGVIPVLMWDDVPGLGAHPQHPLHSSVPHQGWWGDWGALQAHSPNLAALAAALAAAAGTPTPGQKQQGGVSDPGEVSQQTWAEPIPQALSASPQGTP